MLSNQSINIEMDICIAFCVAFSTIILFYRQNIFSFPDLSKDIRKWVNQIMTSLVNILFRHIEPTFFSSADVSKIHQESLLICPGNIINVAFENVFPIYYFHKSCWMKVFCISNLYRNRFMNLMAPKYKRFVILKLLVHAQGIIHPKFS